MTRLFSTGMVIFLLLLLPAATGSGSETPDFKVEGIVAGLTENPGELSVLINGNIFQAGDEIQGHRISALHEKSVTLTNTRNGKELTLQVGEETRPPSPDSSLSREPANAAKKSWLEEMAEKHAPGIYSVMQQAKYAAVIRDLKTIHIAAFQYHVMEGGSSVRIGDLVSRGLLPEFLREGASNGYRFRIQPMDRGIRTFAEPREKTAGARYFMMDEHSYIYTEEGRPATPQSDRFQGGLSFSVMPE